MLSADAQKTKQPFPSMENNGKWESPHRSLAKFNIVLTFAVCFMKEKSPMVAENHMISPYYSKVFQKVGK